MPRIYYIKHIPFSIREWFLTYTRRQEQAQWAMKVYTYNGTRGKTYGIEIYKDGIFFDNSHQGTLEDFQRIVMM